MLSGSPGGLAAAMGMGTAEGWERPWKSSARGMLSFSISTQADSEDSSDEDESESAPGESELGRAARRGNLAEVSQLLGNGAEVDDADREGQTPLFKAAREGHTSVVASLLLAKADMLHTSKAGESVLGATRDESIRALVMAMAPASAGFVADGWQLHEAVSMLPEGLQERVLDATESDVRQIVM